jgi:hypothetical protein
MAPAVIVHDHDVAAGIHLSRVRPGDPVFFDFENADWQATDWRKRQAIDDRLADLIDAVKAAGASWVASYNMPGSEKLQNMYHAWSAETWLPPWLFNTYTLKYRGLGLSKAWPKLDRLAPSLYPDHYADAHVRLGETFDQWRVRADRVLDVARWLADGGKRLTPFVGFHFPDGSRVPFAERIVGYFRSRHTDAVAWSPPTRPEYGNQTYATHGRWWHELI